MNLKSLLRPFFQIASGRLLGQIATFAISPIITRLYSPEEYGASGIVLSIATIGMIVATFRYDQKIITVRTEVARDNLVGLVGILISAFSLILFLVSIFLVVFNVEIIPNERSSSWMLLLVAGLVGLGAAFNQLVPQYLVALGCYWLISVGALVNGVVGSALQVGFGVMHFGPSGLVLGRLAGFAVGLAVMIIPLWSSLPTLFGRIKLRKTWTLAKAYRAQALVLAPSDLVNTLTTFLPVFALSHLFGLGASGAYFFTFNIAGTIMRLYSSTIRPLVVRELAVVARAGKPVLPIIMRIVASTSALSLLGLLILELFGRELIVLVFGSEWKQGGEFLVAMGPYYAVTFVHIPVAGLVSLFNFQRTVLVTESLQFFAVAGSFIAVLFGANAVETICIMSFAMATVYLVSFFFFLSSLRDIDRRAAARQLTVA